MKKTILITGSSSGIGRATAIYFSQKGWNVAATMRKPKSENNLHKLPSIICPQLDVTKPETIKEAISKTLVHFGKIDVVVNNAAYNLTGPFECAEPSQIQAMYDVDVFGVMNVTRAIIPYFRANHNGRIINVTSLGGLIGMPLSSFYASAKWAIEGFSESIRFEMSKLGIKVKIVEPGGVKTQFAQNTIIVRNKDIPTYEESLNKRLSAYEKRKKNLSEPETIAKVIFKAAIDESNRLRYLAGNDAKIFWAFRKILPFNSFSTILNKLAG